jgi:hypothetical protein
VQPTSRRPQRQDNDERKRRSQAETEDGFDDPQWFELGALRRERGVATRRGVEDEEADLVLGMWMVRSKRARVPWAVSSAATEIARRSRAVRPPASPRARNVSTR